MNAENSSPSRRENLENEFKEILKFHDDSFRDLDKKAQYWLTVTLPAFFAILGLMAERELDLSPILVSGATALAVCLLVSIYFLSGVMRCKPVLSGGLRPAPENQQNIEQTILKVQEWKKLRPLQTAELLKAIYNNENTNDAKSKALRKGEIVLFLASPIAALLAGSAAFAHAASGPMQSSCAPITGAVSAGVAIGVIAGLAAVIGTLATSHR